MLAEGVAEGVEHQPSLQHVAIVHEVDAVAAEEFGINPAVRAAVTAGNSIEVPDRHTDAGALVLNQLSHMLVLGVDVSLLA